MTKNRQVFSAQLMQAIRSHPVYSREPNHKRLCKDAELSKSGLSEIITGLSYPTGNVQLRLEKALSVSLFWHVEMRKKTSKYPYYYPNGHRVPASVRELELISDIDKGIAEPYRFGMSEEETYIKQIKNRETVSEKLQEKQETTEAEDDIPSKHAVSVIAKLPKTEKTLQGYREEYLLTKFRKLDKNTQEEFLDLLAEL